MTDQVLGALGADPEPGQAPAESGAPATQLPQETPKPLTADDLAAFEQRIERRLQSLTAKQENRLKKEYERRIAEIETRYELMGVPMPESKRIEVANEVAANFDPDSAQQAAPPAPEAAPNPVLTRAHKIARETCGGLSPADPEFALINQQTPDPFEFIESVQKAAETKAARLALVRQQRAGPPGSTAPMAVTGAPGGGDLRMEYERRKQGVRPGSEAMLKLRQEFRAKGLIDI